MFEELVWEDEDVEDIMPNVSEDTKVPSSLCSLAVVFSVYAFYVMIFSSFSYFVFWVTFLFCKNFSPKRLISASLLGVIESILDRIELEVNECYCELATSKDSSGLVILLLIYFLK